MVGFLPALCLGGCSGSARRLNLVIITLDTLRADVLGAYGDIGKLSPHIDAFAGEATVFENAITTIGTTFPAHASLFTGLYPRRHRVRWSGDTLAEEFVTLAEILSRDGYQTAAFVSMDAMLKRGGLDQGFTVVAKWDKMATNYMYGGNEVNPKAIEWLASRDADPFLLWLHYSETHSPYRLTTYAAEVFDRERYSGPLARGAPTETFYALGQDIPWTETEKMAVRALYEGEVQMLDRLVGEMMDLFRQDGLLENTLFIIAADHGQALGEHDLVGHGFVLWQPVIHVPLMVRDPRTPTPRRVTTRVSLVDILPTTLDLLNLPPLEETDGRSFAASLEGKPLPERILFAEARELALNKRWSAAEAGGIAVFDGLIKAIWKPGEFRVFDLERDAGELAGPAPTVPELKRAELFGLARGYHRKSTVESKQDGVNAELEQELRALGYIE